MKILFFDMEFANGQVPGSIYSFGYLMTDEEFSVVRPCTDLLIDPDAPWNEYVEKNILAYPKELVEASPKFPAVYDQLKALFAKADVAVGFSLNNDTRALRKDCARYGLPMIPFRHFDMEKLCRRMEEYKEAHGLGGYTAAWCGYEPDNRHRSDGDAYATMLLMQAICRKKHVTPEMLMEAFPECVGSTAEKEARTAKKVSAKKRRPRRRKRSAKSEESVPQTV